jgi:hypothetical protein
MEKTPVAIAVFASRNPSGMCIDSLLNKDENTKISLYENLADNYRACNENIL